MCLKEEVYPETMPYAIDVKHDNRMYHLEIPAIAIPKCRACGELVFTHTEDDKILEALRAHAHLLTPQQIKAGRTALGLKKKGLAERLGVAAETISRWETGAKIQSRAMDNLLRIYFAVPEVRTVLRGAEQDPNLGTTAAPGKPEIPGQGFAGVFRTSEVREKARTPALWDPFAKSEAA
jgi:putative zinc finger/helix-turn-helix YgiT family protein